MGTITLDQFNAALTAIGRKPVGLRALTALFELKGQPFVANMVAHAGNAEPQALTSLTKYGQALGLLGTLHALGFPSTTLPQTFALLRARQMEELHVAAAAALRGDAKAKQTLSVWLINAAGEDSGNGSTPASAGAPKAPVGYAGEPPAVTVLSPSGHQMAPPPLNPTAQVTAAGPRTTGSHGTVVPTRAAPPPARPSAPAARRPPEPQGEQRAPSDNVRTHPASQNASRGDPPAATAGGNAPATEGPKYDQVKAFGRQAALTFAADTTRGDDPTVTIEAAAASGTREYNWKEKIRFQLTAPEAQLMLALFWGLVSELHFSNHGEKGDKWMTATRQDDGHYAGTIKFTVGEGTADKLRPRTVQVGYQDRGQIESLFIRRVSALLKLDQDAIARPIKNMADAYVADSAKRAARQPTREEPMQRRA